MKKSTLILWRKTSMNFDVSPKIQLFEQFQSISFLAQRKKRDLVQRWTIRWSCSIGNLMEDFRLVVTKKKYFKRNDITLSRTCFGGIGKSKLQIKDRSIRLWNPVILLKCIRFNWHSKLSWFGTNWIWLLRHYPYYKHSLEFLEFKISGVEIKIDDF